MLIKMPKKHYVTSLSPLSLQLQRMHDSLPFCLIWSFRGPWWYWTLSPSQRPYQLLLNISCSVNTFDCERGFRRGFQPFLWWSLLVAYRIPWLGSHGNLTLLIADCRDLHSRVVIRSGKWTLFRAVMSRPPLNSWLCGCWMAGHNFL